MYKLSKSAGAQFPLNHALRHVHEFALEFDSIRVLCVLHLQHTGYVSLSIVMDTIKI